MIRDIHFVGFFHKIFPPEILTVLYEHVNWDNFEPIVFVICHFHQNVY